MSEETSGPVVAVPPPPMTPVDLVRANARTLTPADDEKIWADVGAWHGIGPVEGHGLSAFEAKAYYTIGLFREMVESAGLIRESDRHLGALFMSLSADFHTAGSVQGSGVFVTEGSVAPPGHWRGGWEGGLT